MRNILLLAALLLSLGIAAQPKNEARIADRIYLDSRDGHGGNQVWVMKKAAEVSQTAEQLSSTDYTTTDWLPAIIPGTVLNSLVYNKVYPEPYYGMNNEINKDIIPDIAKVGRDFYTYWFRTEFEVPANY